MFNPSQAKSKAGKDIVDVLKKAGYGYTQMMNTHLFILYHCKNESIKPIEKDLLLWILQQTIGWQRIFCFFEIKTISIFINHTPNRILKALSSLENMNIIKRVTDIEGYNKCRGAIKIQPDYRLWLLDYDKKILDAALHPKPAISFETNAEDRAKEEEKRAKELEKRMREEQEDLDEVDSLLAQFDD